MNKLASLLLVFSLSALAQTGFTPGITRGDALRHREFKLYSSTTLYVDASAGDDVYPCTVTLPCATFAKAWSLVPYYVPADKAVTINIAAGTYTEGMDLSGRRIDGQLNIMGTSDQCEPGEVLAPTWSPVTVTPASGTHFTLIDPVPPVASPVNVYRGCLFEVQSGTSAGTKGVIRGNDVNTVLEVADTLGLDPDNTSVIAMTRPAATFTGLVAGKSAFRASLTGGGDVRITLIDFNAGSALWTVASQPSITIEDSWLRRAFQPTGSPTRFTFTRDFISGGAIIPAVATLDMEGGLVYCATCDSAFETIAMPSYPAYITGSFDGTFGNIGMAFSFTNAELNVGVRCDNAATALSATGAKIYGYVRADGCTSGIEVSGQSFVAFDGVIDGASTQAATVSGGSMVQLDGNPFTVNAPVTVDNTAFYSADVADAGFVHGPKGSTLSFNN